MLEIGGKAFPWIGCSEEVRFFGTSSSESDFLAQLVSIGLSSDMIAMKERFSLVLENRQPFLYLETLHSIGLGEYTYL